MCVYGSGQPAQCTAIVVHIYWCETAFSQTGMVDYGCNISMFLFVLHKLLLAMFPGFKQVQFDM